MLDNSRLTGISHRFSHNNLHITCRAFQRTDASAIMGLLKEYADACNRIFIDVSGVEKPEKQTIQGFQNAMQGLQVAPKKIFFKGQEGFSLAVNGNHVLVKKTVKHENKKHACCGRCAHCHCHE